MRRFKVSSISHNQCFRRLPEQYRRRRPSLSPFAYFSTAGTANCTKGHNDSSSSSSLRTTLAMKQLEQTSPRFRPFVYSPDGIALELEVSTGDTVERIQSLAYAGKTTLSEVIEELEENLRHSLQLEKTPKIDVELDGEKISEARSRQAAFSDFSGHRIAFKVHLGQEFQGTNKLSFNMAADERLHFPTTSAKRTLYMGYAYMGGGAVVAAVSLTWLGKFVFT